MSRYPAVPSPEGALQYQVGQLTEHELEMHEPVPVSSQGNGCLARDQHMHKFAPLQAPILLTKVPQSIPTNTNPKP